MGGFTTRHAWAINRALNLGKIDIFMINLKQN
jgi:hypothetical protein